jgi:hypothetical protein
MRSNGDSAARPREGGAGVLTRAVPARRDPGSDPWTGWDVGLLKKLIQAACRRAIESGEERITEQLIRELTIGPGDLPDLDADAGEVPDIPAGDHPRPNPRIPAPRNTVFDDKGPRPESAAG